MIKPLSPRHSTALLYASDRIPIFPCVVGGKRPATARGFLDRTTDEATINRWWSLADFNIGVVPEDMGMAVIDIDPKHNGHETWARLIALHGEPRCDYEVRTPSGGRHLYFIGSLPSSAGVLGEGIDTRGRSSYCLVPPSIVDGVEYVEA